MKRRLFHGVRFSSKLSSYVDRGVGSERFDTSNKTLHLYEAHTYHNLCRVYLKQKQITHFPRKVTLCSLTKLHLKDKNMFIFKVTIRITKNSSNSFSLLLIVGCGSCASWICHQNLMSLKGSTNSAFDVFLYYIDNILKSIISPY